MDYEKEIFQIYNPEILPCFFFLQYNQQNNIPDKIKKFLDNFSKYPDIHAVPGLGDNLLRILSFIYKNWFKK